jgi:beta-glucosidase
MSESSSSSSKLFCPFPKNFLWGAATASYQIEGAANDDGRGPSVWDTFTHARPGAIANDDTGDRATDHYHRFKDDVALMKELGLKAYRFSVSWSRVFPDASGTPNTRGLDFYQRLIDELRRNDIAPWMTLFHWDLPQWCEDKYRGWESKDCAKAFADYAGFMAGHLGDRLGGVMTINEFVCFLDKAYTANREVFAPGKVVSPKVLAQSRHHAVYAHGLAAQAVRAACAKPPPVGLAENAPACVPLLEQPEHVAAARAAFREMTGQHLVPIFEGKYHPAYLESLGPDAPTFTDKEMSVINTPLDFVGLNLYAPVYVRSDPNTKSGWSTVRLDENYPKMHMPWLNIGPQILYWAPRFVAELWKVPAVYVTENGCAYPDRPNEKGEVLDPARVMFLQQQLIHAQRATAEGYPLKGYFLWSLLDNFEWAYGYTKRFGITYVNYQTMQRTPKLSARFYQDVIKRNAVGG